MRIEDYYNSLNERLAKSENSEKYQKIELNPIEVESGEKIAFFISKTREMFEKLDYYSGMDKDFYIGQLRGAILITNELLDKNDWA